MLVPMAVHCTVGPIASHLLDSEKKATLDKVPAKCTDLANARGAHLWGKQVCGRVALVSPPIISKSFLGLTGI